MSSIEITINEKLYKIGCSEETVEDIKQYTKELNLRINNFKIENPASFMGLSQEALFLLQALSLVSELNEVKENQTHSYQLEILDLNNKVKQLTKTIENLQKVVK